MMRRTLMTIGAAGICLAAAAPAWATFPGANGRIAYDASNFSIHTVLPSGRGDRQITPTHLGSTPAWSPDGRRIAFTGAGGITTQPEIFSMAADGTHLRRLTHNALDDSSPAYAPGGHRLVFTRTGTSAPWVM